MPAQELTPKVGAAFGRQQAPIARMSHIDASRDGVLALYTF